MIVRGDAQPPSASEVSHDFPRFSLYLPSEQIDSTFELISVRSMQICDGDESLLRMSQLPTTSSACAGSLAWRAKMATAPPPASTTTPPMIPAIRQPLPFFFGGCG